MSEPTEQNDLARSLEGDGEAYARIVAKFQTQVARRMRLFANDPAAVEELVQEVFVEAYFSLSRYREGNFPGWLTQIATRVGYRYWKKTRRRAESGRDDQWWRQLAQSKVEALDSATVARLVRALLDRLPPRDRLVLLLVYIEGHSMDEAARLAGWSKTMVKVQAFRARRKLRAFFAELGIDSAQAAGESSEDILHERI
ncbi:MAG TPA: RNA polymerase sigma factor [Pirellulales bacterium]